MKWSMVIRLEAAIGVTVAGIGAALVLHGHQFTLATDGTPDLPAWRDPLALVCAFGAMAAAVALARRARRIGLALGILGSALAGAVYLHQQAVQTFNDRWLAAHPCVYCPAGWTDPAASDLWNHPASMLIVVLGMATAALLLLPRRWLVSHRVHLRRR